MCSHGIIVKDTLLSPASKGLFTRREGYSSKRVTLALSHFLLFILRRPYNAARVTLAGELTFSFVNTPGTGRVTRLPVLNF